MSAAERERLLLELVRSTTATVLSASIESVEPERPLRELGLDSLMAVELRNRLSAASGLRLPATLLFDYPTPRALAETLSAKLDPKALRTALSLFWGSCVELQVCLSEFPQTIQFEKISQHTCMRW